MAMSAMARRASMIARRAAIFLAVASKFASPLAVPDLALAQETQPLEAPNPDDLKHGAVLCAWAIYVAAKEIGDKCYAQKDVQFQAVLNESIARIDQFIVDNAPTTHEQLEKSKRERAFLGRPDNLCKSAGLYEMLRKSGPDDIRLGVGDLLSVPRKPVWNPCL